MSRVCLVLYILRDNGERQDNWANSLHGNTSPSGPKLPNRFADGNTNQFSIELAFTLQRLTLPWLLPSDTVIVTCAKWNAVAGLLFR